MWSQWCVGVAGGGGWVRVNLALHPSGVAESSTSFGWGKGGNVTSAEWQVTLCDPMWQVSSRSGVATLRTAIHLLLTYLQGSVTRNGSAVCATAVRCVVLSHGSSSKGQKVKVTRSRDVWADKTRQWMVISTSNLVGIIDVGVDACGILSRSWIFKNSKF